MKTLDVSGLHSGIDEIKTKIEHQQEQLKQIETSVMGIVRLSDSLKGEGGTAIRRFYQVCHLPFIHYLTGTLAQYEHLLMQMKSSLQALEPASNGRIQESFLEQEVENGLKQVELVTTALTNQTNATMQKVQDIVYLKPLQDDEVRQYVQKAKQEKDQTREQLHQFDYEQSAALCSVEANVNIMKSYTQNLSSMFQRQGSDIVNFSLNSLSYQASYTMLKSNLSNKQHQHYQIINQMNQPTYLRNTGMQQSLGFDKWVNPSCPRPDTINQSTVVQDQPPWWEKASNKIIDSAKSAGNKIVDGAKTTARVVNENSREISSAILDFTPILGNVKAGYEATHGVDPITKRELEDWEQTLMIAAVLGGGFVKAGVRGTRGVKSVGFTGKENFNRKEALQAAKDLAGVPRSQQPLRQWQVGDNINMKGGNFKNYEFSSNPTHHGRYFEYETPQGKRVIVEHINDGRMHTHAGKPKDGANPFNYDFKKERYSNIYGSNKDHHIYYKK
ncbi:T7SS effector LXG polymorphic toxin [Alkalihalophilus marmarensis]|uniref:T7SS effector LXG polymorphic toxin n=1 Tax=Alkalihalophilus marmarensis TaxID=521377 RepID=UPI002E1D435D|nr:T7SS effector LXG polymorphic toxin [Alkalihalophilus marmarensis]